MVPVRPRPEEPHPEGQPSRGKADGPPHPEPNLWSLAGAGLELAAGVGAFTALGWWLDRRFGTAPWLMVIGGGLGLVGGLYNLWKQSKRYL